MPRADLANLIVRMMPALLLAGLCAARGGGRAALVWLGLMMANAYTFVIYGFGVHRNALYLPYHATLGLSF